MTRVTCRYPGGYSGDREPGGDPRLRLDLAYGDVADVSPEKAAQLLRDFPGYFTTAEEPARRGVAPNDGDTPVQSRRRAPRKGDA